MLSYVLKMNVQVWTRHSATCPKKANRFTRQCHCPKWLYWHTDGRAYKRSARTRSWEKATHQARALEIAHEEKRLGQRTRSNEPISIAAAVKAYIDDKKVQGRSEETLYKLTVLLEKQLLAWSLEQGLYYLLDLELAHLRRFRQAMADGEVSESQSQKNSPQSLKKKHERMAGFFHFCVREKWIAENPASALSRIKVTAPPTDYFPPEEMKKIIDATYVYDQKVSRSVGEFSNNATRLHVLLLLMRWSGLALGDAVALERARLSSDNTLLLRRQKTGVPVYVLLPEFVAKALREVPPGPKPNKAYFFWSGNGQRKSAVKDWQRAFRRLFKIADIHRSDGSTKRCFPHMFRDTFAVENLLAGMPLDEVSMLLGHSSVKTTEKYYAPWVRARQLKLIESQKKAWAEMKIDPETGLQVCKTGV